MDSEHLAIVQDILQSHIPDLEVWIFGSRATGKAKNTSDLDIAIIANDPIDMMLLANIKDTFSESNLPFKVDIVDYGNVSPEFRKLITKEKLVLQK